MQDEVQSVRVAVPRGACHRPSRHPAAASAILAADPAAPAPADQGGQKIRRETERHEEGRSGRPGRHQHQPDPGKLIFLKNCMYKLQFRKVHFALDFLVAFF